MYLFQKGDMTQNWRVPLWPVAFAAAFGSMFLLTGVLLQLIAAWTILSGDDSRSREAGAELRRPALPNSGPARGRDMDRRCSRC